MEIIIIGLLLGATYALMAMGLQLQYGVARIMNLANGEMLIAGAFGTFWFYTASNASPFFALIFVIPLAFAPTGRSTGFLSCHWCGAPKARASSRSTASWQPSG